MANFIKRNRNSIVKIIFAVLLGVIFYNTALPKIAALPFDYCDIGQEVTAKIIEINNEKNRIAVSIKQTKEKPKPKKINKKSNNKDFDKIEPVEDSFEVMLKKYKRQSDDTLQMLNRRGKKHTRR